MIRATGQQWRACANVLRGHPAFVLGNGPTLPSDLTPLDGFFTVGVNRILYHYDPTVVMWFDANVVPDIADRLATCEAIPFTNDEINHGQWNGLKPYGTRLRWVDEPLRRPDYVAATGNSGASAAYWAMSLGCRVLCLFAQTR